MTTRIFTVEVTGCKNCPKAYFDESYMSYRCGVNDIVNNKFKMFKQNQHVITPSCPMYQYSFVKDEKK
jgi:hypothetical protein